LKITVKCQRSRADGILNFDGFQSLTIMNVPKSADVNVGDLFITSEYSNHFPAGIPIGIVIESGNLDNLFKKVVVKPAVNFETLEEVFVLNYIPDIDKINFEKNMFSK
jgi:rod shape-determining protein MreC